MLMIFILCWFREKTSELLILDDLIVFAADILSSLMASFRKWAKAASQAIRFLRPKTHLNVHTNNKK